MVIKCKDCGFDVDSNLNTCPHCGSLLKEYRETPVKNNYIEYNSVKGSNLPLAIISLVMTFIFPLFGFIFGIITMRSEKSIYLNIKTQAYSVAKVAVIISTIFLLISLFIMIILFGGFGIIDTLVTN